ncbi:uncharacterized protein LOC110766634 [Prunus avium]|uniref:ADP-ribosyl cyclase/cyclic ADP-ribose hydrolase n=1 Tax=Prunus avium TaxID=42229 RepID=A0A6P5TES5_PRUAV|nr:uncharacterized protein LOC110766634 [Prunus avium]
MTSSSSSSTPETLDFDVFLRFRGEDTCNSFRDHLYHGLKLKGIDTFSDEEKLERRKPKAPKLLKAVEHSKFAVVVLFEDYASSTWCLDELAHIVQCMKEARLEVFPVFYHIEASEHKEAPVAMPLSSSSSTPETLDFDVFLSFRGKDTCNSFMDHLLHGLKLKGINTFRDEEKLERGKLVTPKLLKGIEHSQFAVAVLSEDYASSTWCFDELAHFVQCMKEARLEVLPEGI